MIETVVPTAPEAVGASTAVLVEVAGVPTTVRRAGQGTPVLFLHGSFFPTAWLPFHDVLARRVDLIAPIHPGYVEGGPPDWLRGFDDLVLHYHDLLDVLRLPTVHLVGYDLGGWIAAQIAAYYPDRVRSFTAIAATGLRVPEAPPLEFLAASPARVADALFNGDPSGHLALLPDPDDIDSFVEGYGQNGVTARLIWERRYDPRLDRRLQRLRMPALVVWPGEDRMVPFAHARRWMELLPHARLAMLEDVGHALLVQAPDEVAATVAGFVEEVDGS